MSAYLLAQATIPHDSGVAADAVTFTTHWMNTSEATVDAVASNAFGKVAAFIQEARNFYSSVYNPEAAVIKLYNVLDPEPRVPVLESAVAISSVSTNVNDLPAEVAIVISYEAAGESGANMKRRRGRFYFGPLAVVSGDYSFIPNATVDFFAQIAWEQLVEATGVAVFATYSKYTAMGIPVGGTPTSEDEEQPELVPGSHRPVVTLWVDNAWDTQRRRGLTATYRKTYSS